MNEAPPDRQYPARPIVGVGAVVIVDQQQILLIKRQRHPLAGRWSLPGGALELGETLHDAIRREVREETALEIEVGPVIDVFEPIDRDDRNAIRYHYVVIDYLCRQVGGTLQAASDAAAAVIADPDDLDAYDLPALARQVIARGLEMAQQMGWAAPGPRRR